jgi:hypothetical protein
MAGRGEVIKESIYNTLFGTVTIGKDNKVKLESANVTSYLSRELGIGKKLSKLSIFATALKDPAAYLGAKIADIQEIEGALEPVFTSAYKNAISYGDSDEQALAKSIKVTKDYYNDQLSQHKQRFPPEITKKFKLGQKLE